MHLEELGVLSINHLRNGSAVDDIIPLSARINALKSIGILANLLLSTHVRPYLVPLPTHVHPYLVSTLTGQFTDTWPYVWKCMDYWAHALFALLGGNSATEFDGRPIRSIRTLVLSILRHFEHYFQVLTGIPTLQAFARRALSDTCVLQLMARLWCFDFRRFPFTERIQCETYASRLLLGIFTALPPSLALSSALEGSDVSIDGFIAVLCSRIRRNAGQSKKLLHMQLILLRSLVETNADRGVETWTATTCDRPLSNLCNAAGTLARALAIHLSAAELNDTIDTVAQDFYSLLEFNRRLYTLC